MSAPTSALILDDYAVQVNGDLSLTSTGTGTQVTIQAGGTDSSVQIDGNAGVSLTASGQAVVAVNSTKKQATITGVESVKIGVGPPAELGAVIDLTPTGITLSLAKLITITMSPTGVVIKAAETSLEVGVAGITLTGPLLQAKGEAAHKLQTTIEQQQTSATRQFQAGVDMLG